MVTIQPSQVSPRNSLRDGVKAVALPNGLTLPYVERGDRSGLPVVLLHGITDSWRSWETVLPHLPPSIRAIALTQRGHGDADRPEDGYRFEDFAADLAAFIDALALGPVIIAGHSLGSAVAQRFAIDHPERVLGLVLVGSVTTWRGNPAFKEIWEAGISTLTDPIDPAFVRAFQESPRLPRTMLEAAVRESLKVPARVWRAGWQALMETDHSWELFAIEAPTLIVWGDQDPLCPRPEQEALLTAIADARLVIYPGGGHNLHWEEPRRFAADLTAFARGLAG